jgi:hypothetical protein
MSRLPPPISDYVTDTRGVLDNSARLAQVSRPPLASPSQQHDAVVNVKNE